MGRIDEQHPQPSGGSHLDGTDLQLSIANEEEVSANLPTVEQQIERITQAEDEKSSAFVVSQEDIDSVLQMGSSYDKSKYRIYRQLQKNSDSKTNIEFLKKEYGTGGGTHIFPDGTQGGRWADSKGIAIEKQGSYTDPDLRLSWSKVEKRLRELIKNDRYLNPKEKDHYADYLEQVSAPQYEIDTQRKLARQRFIQSKQALSPVDKRDSLALRLSDFIRDLDGYEKELLSQVNRTDLANINDRQMEEQLSDPAMVQQLLDFLALVQGKTSDTYSRSNAWYFSKELTELHPMHYLCHEGDEVRVLDLINMHKSHCYNPFVYLKNDNDVQRLVTNLFKATTPKGSQSQDPFWDTAASMLLLSLVFYLKYEAPKDEQNFPMVMELLRAGEVHEEELLKQNEPEAQEIALAIELFTDGSLNTFAKHTNVDTKSRLICYDILDLGKQLQPIGMLVVLDSILNRITQNRAKGRNTFIFIDEIYLLFQHEYSANFLFTLWKRVRKYGAYCTGITQNVDDLLQSHTARTMLANSEFIIMLNQASTDRLELAKLLNISDLQMSYITNVGAGQGLLKVGSSLVPFVNKFPRNTELYRLMTTKFGEV